MMIPPPPGYCACGQPLHYSDPQIRRMTEEIIALLGEDAVVTIGRRHWKVPRHYIALHGLRASQVPDLGFPEIADD